MNVPTRIQFEVVGCTRAHVEALANHKAREYFVNEPYEIIYHSLHAETVFGTPAFRAVCSAEPPYTPVVDMSLLINQPRRKWWHRWDDRAADREPS